ncbi:MAG: DUF1320 domain-containing protein [Armatimonadetes bacterium]|nr:DUF1320 domain-containing protein [Armatimonadota bacterium]MDW8122694.1 hypothetical protein [Armatimonadota bacterium]
MPVYHTLDDVQARLPGPMKEISPASDPSDTTVITWMDEVETYVLTELSARYPLPITGPESLRVLRSLCSDLTAARVWRHRTVGTSDPFPPRYADLLEQNAKKLLEALRDGTVRLPDHPQKTTPDRPIATLPDEPKVFSQETQW